MAGSVARDLGIVLLIGFAALTSACPAEAGSTATRCNAQGCVHIHCNSTGDRCFRYADGHRVAPFEDRNFRYGGAPDPSPLTCDSDGDRCYPSLGARWNFREYYRRLGYRWNDESH
jgi:hypothetical protein